MEIARILGILFAIILAVILPIFIFFIVLYLLAIFGVEFMASIQDDLKNGAVGWIMILFPGSISLVSIIMLVIAWMLSMKWKDLRYKMAFFLYHSKVKNGDRIPLGYLARVGVCSKPEITRTLEIMISRKELKGEINRLEDIYIHRGITRKGMKFLQALPPAKMDQLGDVKKWALKGVQWESQDPNSEDTTPELDEDDIEELPSAKNVLNDDMKKVECAHCGRMNIKDHHFCTFCGEVI